MYDAVWQLCTDAMATLAFSGEVCLHVHVLLSDDDSRGLAKQPVKCLNLKATGPTICLYPLVAPIM